MINSTNEDFEKNFPTETHEKKVFDFTKEEVVTVRTYNAIKTLGEMAGLFIDNMLNGMILPKVGIHPRQGVGTIYDAATGKYTVYIPKNYCVTCNEQVGTTKIDEKWYCNTCAGLVQIRKEMEKKDVESTNTNQNDAVSSEQTSGPETNTN